MVTNISHSVTNNLTGHRMQLAETLSYKHDDNFFTREKTSQVKCWWNHDVDDNDDFNGDGSVIFTAPCWRTCHNHIPWHFPDRILKRICGSKISARRGGIGMMMVMMNKTSGGPPPPPPPPGTEIPWPCFWSHSSQPLGRTHGQKFLDFEIWIRSARLCWLYFQPEKFPSKNCQLEWFLIPSGFSPFPIPSCRPDIWSVKPPHQQHHLHYHHYYQEGKGTLLHLPYPFLLCRIPWIHPLCKGLLNSGNKKILPHTTFPEGKTDNTKFL